MASIGWQGISIVVATVLVAGCTGFLFLARDLAHDTVVQPVIEPVKTHRVVQHSREVYPTHPQENERIPQDTTDTGDEARVIMLMQAMNEGLTQIVIIEELDPSECQCSPPRLDRAYLISARECRYVCACVNENDPWISPRVELFPAE